MVCKNCKMYVEDGETVCKTCGAIYPGDKDGGPSWFFLGLILPQVGLTLYIVWQTQKPNSAKFAGIGALVGFIISIILGILII